MKMGSDNKQQGRPAQGGQQAAKTNSGEYSVITVYTSPNEAPEAHGAKISALLNEQAQDGRSFVCWWPHPSEMFYVQAVFRKNEK